MMEHRRVGEPQTGPQEKAPPNLASGRGAHVHGGVDLRDRLVVRGELVDLDAVADQLTHDLDLELVELALGDGVGFGYDGDYVYLWLGGEREGGWGGKRERKRGSVRERQRERERETETEREMNMQPLK